MKKTSVDKLAEKMVIGENIIDAKGNILVAAGMTLTEKLIERIKSETKAPVFVLEKGEKIEKKETSGSSESEGMKFLNGLKDKLGIDMGKKGNEKAALRDDMSAVSRDTKKESSSSKYSQRDEKRPVIVIKKESAPVQRKEILPQENQTTDFFKETKDKIKDIIIKSKEQGSLIPLSMSEENIKLLNNILIKKDVLSALQKMKEYDEYLYEHSLYVGLKAVMAGEMFGFQKIVVFSMALGGLMADYGMVEVPKEIIMKKAVLKPEEKEIVKQHSAKSYAAVSKILHTTDIAKEIVLNHHERPDGAGYPKGKKGEEISQYAKIITIIDVYHALISERPYHAAKTHKEAFYTLVMNKGKQFDDKILAELIKKQGGK